MKKAWKIKRKAIAPMAEWAMDKIPLSDYVVNVTTAKDIRLHSFKVDFTKLEGEFRARFDGVECRYPFPFLFDYKGLLCATVTLEPYYHTELMRMVELPPGALEAMTRALREDIFPDIAPYREGKGDDLIWFKTPIEKRLKDPRIIEQWRARVERPDFEYKVELPA